MVEKPKPQQETKGYRSVLGPFAITIQLTIQGRRMDELASTSIWLADRFHATGCTQLGQARRHRPVLTQKLRERERIAQPQVAQYVA